MEHVGTIAQTIIMSLISLTVLFILAKVIGNKQLSEINLFDYINGITIGSIGAELATGEPSEYLRPLVAMVFYGLATAGISIWASKSRKARKTLSGEATVLMDNGQIYREKMKKTRLDLDEFLGMLRVMGYFDISQIKTVILEANGRLSVLPKAANRPMTPLDASLHPAEESVFYNVVMDGRVMTDNLRRAGHDERWLERALDRRGCRDVSEIFLAACDASGTLHIYKTA